MLRHRPRPSILIGLAALILVLSLAPIVFALVDNDSSTGDEDDRPIRIVATTGMIGDLVTNIGGKHVEVVTMLPPGVDPHRYEPTAGDIESLQDADVIFSNGLGLEGRLTDDLAVIASTGTPTVALAEAIPEHRLRQPVGLEGTYDPHIWFDISLWRSTAETVTSVLTEFEPDLAAEFATNRDAYVLKLDEMDAYARGQIARIQERSRVLVTAHAAFGYFGHRYGMEVRGLQDASTSVEATANDVRQLADFLVERQITVIFVESSVPHATIVAVREQTQARGWDVQIGGQVFSDALGEADTLDGTYLGVVRHNVDTIAAALT